MAAVCGYIGRADKSPRRPLALGGARETRRAWAQLPARLEDGEEAACPRGPGSAGFAACPRPGPAASRAPDAWRAAADPTPGPGRRALGGFT